MAKQKINIIICMFCCIIVSCGTNRYENLLTNADRKFWLSINGSSGIAFDKEQKILNITNWKNDGRFLPPLYKYKFEKNKITYNDDMQFKDIDTLTILNVSKNRLVLFSVENKHVYEYTANYFEFVKDEELYLYAYEEILKQIVKFCNSERKGYDSIYVYIPALNVHPIAKNYICNMELPISFIKKDCLLEFDHKRFFTVGSPYQMNGMFYCTIGYGEHIVDDRVPFISRSYCEFQWLFVFKKKHDGRFTMHKIIKHKF